ncbi:amidase family protein [Pseudonocardia benzenivorans]
MAGAGRLGPDHPGAFGPDVGGRFAFAATVTADQADTARETVRDARERLRRLLADTVLVLPASSGPAPSLHAGKDIVEDERTATVRLTQLASLAGAPAVALPVLWMSDGRPVGLCLVGAPDTDRALLALGRTVTEALAAAAASR